MEEGSPPFLLFTKSDRTEIAPVSDTVLPEFFRLFLFLSAKEALPLPVRSQPIRDRNALDRLWP